MERAAQKSLLLPGPHPKTCRPPGSCLLPCSKPLPGKKSSITSCCQEPLAQPPPWVCCHQPGPRPLAPAPHVELELPGEAPGLDIGHAGPQRCQPEGKLLTLEDHWVLLPCWASPQPTAVAAA
ncbi:hypothetical protein Y1Q_0013506 [Alligator mississippiensis]|uniref:Uncharacterized protein n=1 Tax=Alligator mississippiensis TaxID=8496 RepID=A0A151P2Z4_ALLMI|nr:hypothetical protein Y1Q_0013506 [Alligator mississippiensis]